MPKKTGNKSRSQASVIAKGTVISVIGAVVGCAAASFLISREYISEKWTIHALLSILLSCSFLGAKYSNICAQGKRAAVTMLTGLMFILILMAANLMMLSAEYDDFLIKVTSVLVGTVLAAINLHGNRQGRGPVKRRHNR